MAEFSFTLRIAGADVMAAASQDALFDAGCGDATFGVSEGVMTADFDREARDLDEAVASAIAAIEATVPRARVVEVLL